MNTSLHKTKELMPLLISVVNENEGLLDPQLVEEFNQIYSEQMIAGRKDSMNYKLLGTTGIKCWMPSYSIIFWNVTKRES